MSAPAIRPLEGKAKLAVELATHRINLFEGSVRSGKTISSLLWWLRYVRTGPAGPLLMVGKTERTLRRNVIDPLVEMLGSKRCKPNWGDGELMLLGRKIYLVGANNEAAVSKIQGMTLAGAYGDEIVTWPESFFAMLLTRLSVDGAQLGGTMNPDNPRHWMMRNYLGLASVHLRHDGQVIHHDGLAPDGRERLDLARFSFNLRDNPSLGAAYVAALEKEFTGLWHKRFIDGLWVMAEGAIFDMLEVDVGGPHVTAYVPPVDEWVVAVDYGTTNPFVALLLGLTHDDRMVVAREWRWDSRARRRQLTDAEYAQHLRTWLDGLPAELGQPVRPSFVIVDPSAASFITQLWRDGWEGVRKADNTVVDGIRSVSSLLARQRLTIHASCAGLLDEMASYVWDPKAAERGEERPVKVDDHGPDALRYGVMGTRPWWRHWLMVDVETEQPAAA